MTLFLTITILFIGLAMALSIVAILAENKRLNDRIDLLTQMGKRQRGIIQDLYSPQLKENKNQLLH